MDQSTMSGHFWWGKDEFWRPKICRPNYLLAPFVLGSHTFLDKNWWDTRQAPGGFLSLVEQATSALTFSYSVELSSTNSLKPSLRYSFTCLQTSSIVLVLGMQSFYVDPFLDPIGSTCHSQTIASRRKNRIALLTWGNAKLHGSIHPSSIASYL
jgi:hypothetical protein